MNLRRNGLRGGLVTALVVIWASAASAADPQPNAPPDPTPDARQKMATIHEKMAACLRSDRPMAECRADMWKSCQEQMGADGCPMMGAGGGMGPGMMHRGMMQGGTTGQGTSQ
jgi:hypothetical protein